VGHSDVAFIHEQRAMTRASLPSFSALYMTVAAAVTAVLTVLLLGILAAPTDFRLRVDDLARHAVELQASARRSGEPEDLPLEAVCTGPPDRQIERVRAFVTSTAQAQKLDLKRLQIGIELGSHLNETLTPVRVRFQAEGGYEGALGMLDALSRMRPILFADSVDLRSKTSSVVFDISGRMFCSA
jgi:hypothetical protein